MDSQAFIDDLRKRLRAFFTEQAQGWDVPPATLYRLEGAMASAVQLGLVSEAELRGYLLHLAEEFLDENLQGIYRNDRQLLLHLHMHEAPVYPSGGSQ